MKVLLSFLFCCFFGLTLSGQSYSIDLERDGKTKTLKLREGQDLMIGTDIIEDANSLIVKSSKGELARIDGSLLFVKVKTITTCEYVDDKCVKEATINFKGNEVVETYKLEEIHFIARHKNAFLRNIHILSTTGASLFLTILNPLISTDFTENKLNSKLWLRSHLVSLAVLAEGITYLSTSKMKFTYLKENPVIEEYWNATIK